MKITKWLLVALLLPASILSAGGALANQCIEFGQIPIRITKAGCYLLRSDITVNDPNTDAITIETSDVEINLNGHQIINLSGPKTSANGIYANSVRNVSIKNGQISGYLYAIRIDGGSNGVNSSSIDVRNVVLRGNFFRGISIEATKARVAENKVLNTGGTTLFEDAFAVAIEMKGNSCTVEKNYIDGIFPTGIGEGVGISLSNSRKDCHIINNNINNGKSGGGTFGIWLVNEDVLTEVKVNNIVDFIFPFNIPRLADTRRTIMKTITISHNTLKNSKCSVYSHPSYFRGLSLDNEFLGEKMSCPVLIKFRENGYLKNPNNPRSVFQFAVSKYWCASEPLLSDGACCKQQEDSIWFYEKAAKLGLAEAERVLPGVRNAVKNSPACLRSKVADNENAVHPKNKHSD